MKTTMRRACRTRWWMAGLLAGLLCGCAPLTVDRSLTAVSQDSRVQFIVLHYTVGNFRSALNRLSEGPVSSHYLVRDDPPTVYQLVDENRRAWHAGASAWAGHTSLNGTSVGIEIVNPGFVAGPPGHFAPYPEDQVAQVVALVRDVVRRHKVPPHHVLGHSDIAPQNKQDPGPMFPWRRLVQAGLVAWPDEAQVAAALPAFEAALPEVAWFQQKLAQHGFAVPRTGELDEATRSVLSAFQMKYRPARYDGQPDAETAALLQVATTPGGLYFVDGQGGRQVFRPESP